MDLYLSSIEENRVIYFHKEFQIYYVSKSIAIGLRSEFVRCVIGLSVLELEP